MPADPFASVYGDLNWDAPRGPRRCEECGLGEPVAGAYPSALFHFEQVLGDLGGDRSDARILFVLLDPRNGEANFQLAPPTQPASVRAADEHRYFCLTAAAWHALSLDRATGSATPCWPDPKTAHHYLRRYLSSGGSWSYDGFLAYFIWLFRPRDAGVTDLAMCHFGRSQGPDVYACCAETKLSRLIELLSPNMVVSFTSVLNDRFVADHVPALAGLPRLSLLHPAARGGREPHSRRFLEQLAANRTELEPLALDVDAIAMRWKANAARDDR
jgi:hypothetical protein